MSADAEDRTATGLATGEREALLAGTSRTFALAIPLLVPPLDAWVGLAYLLFRIADTLEDATLWTRDERLAALASFEAWLAPQTAHAAQSATDTAHTAQATPGAFIEATRAKAPCEKREYVELVLRADGVRAEIDACPAAVRGAIFAHVARTVTGMAEFVATQGADGSLALATVADLQRYCWFVAGIVGELLTELFVFACPELAPRRDALHADAAAFGEGLQLVNILKDAGSDAREGRVYLPRNFAPAEITKIARADLVRAAHYVAELCAVDAEIARAAAKFTGLSLALAVATLDRLDEGGAKLGRDEVARIFTDIVGKSI